MNPLLEQFLLEAREFLQGIGEKLMRLEDAPGDPDLINELFRLVHTLKGNTGLFEFPEMTRVLHAAEDLMDAVRHGRVAFTRELADRLLDAMDFVGQLCDGLDTGTPRPAAHAPEAERLAAELRRLHEARAAEPTAAPAPEAAPLEDGWDLAGIPEPARMAAYREAGAEGAFLVLYRPDANCFYQGEDPFFHASRTPGLHWGALEAVQPWGRLEELDAYRSNLAFRILTTAARVELLEHFRYVPDQVVLLPLPALSLVLPVGDPNGGPVYEDFVAEALTFLEGGRLADLAKGARALVELSNPDLWLASALRWLLALLDREPGNAGALRALVTSLRTFRTPVFAPEAEGPEPPAAAEGALPAEVLELLAVQRSILAIQDDTPWRQGRIQAAHATIAACLRAMGRPDGLAAFLAGDAEADPGAPAPEAAAEAPAPKAEPPAEGEARFGRRAEDTPGAPRSLKVDQAKIDRLLNLIGEMVVSKNALPYLAGRAENVYGVRELSREIKAQYAVINRIAEELQDAIMQVCMMPVSAVFQRFPRLVRDTSRKLGKEVNLVLVGEGTEADKNIIEALGDPLIHIIRNSLDHGFETPDVRVKAGKPAAGTLTIRAAQVSDRVVIEIQDDGRGIDPLQIKRKAYENGVIDEATLDRLTDAEAVNLVFAAGLSTAAVVSDLSGRGVGMDVVRAAVARVNGTIHLESELGKGTLLRLSLPLSMAVTNVMIVEADGQVFGVPMDLVVETVRVPRARIRTIKQSLATVLRGRIVALKALGALLGLPQEPRANADDELAVLVVRLGAEPVGLLVDQFHETADVILKPMTGVLAGLPAYAGSALLGDGSVLMILNLKEVL